MTWRRRIVPFALLITLSGCAGFYRSCAACRAEQFGASFVVVQFDYRGDVFNCWKVYTGIENEPGSDGIWWQAKDGHLVHVSGWYNRVQVYNDDWRAASGLLGVEIDRCTGGRYTPPKPN